MKNVLADAWKQFADVRKVIVCQESLGAEMRSSQVSSLTLPVWLQVNISAAHFLQFLVKLRATNSQLLYK